MTAGAIFVKLCPHILLSELTKMINLLNKESSVSGGGVVAGVNTQISLCLRIRNLMFHSSIAYHRTALSCCTNLLLSQSPWTIRSQGAVTASAESIAGLGHITLRWTIFGCNYCQTVSTRGSLTQARGVFVFFPGESKGLKLKN